MYTSILNSNMYFKISENFLKVFQSKIKKDMI